MKYIYFSLFCLVLSSCSSSYGHRERGGDSIVSSSSESYIVKTTKDFDTSLFASVGGFYDGAEPNTNLFIEGQYYLIKKASNITSDEFINRLEALSGVYYACENEKIEEPKVVFGRSFSSKNLFRLDGGNLDGDPSARYYEYALRVTHARDYVDADGNKQQGAYTKVGYGPKTAVIAIIDSGINLKHPDFKKDKSICLYAKSSYAATITNQGGYYDFQELSSMRELNLDSNEDYIGHGTHCSGTMCAVEGNNEGIAGVAYKNTYIISYKGLGIRGGSMEAVYSPLADLVEIVTILKKPVADRSSTEKAKIPKTVPADFVITQKTIPVNMSLGSGGTSKYAVEMLNLAIRNNILPVIAMGNDGRSQPAYPRSLYGCIAVGATTDIDKRADFSDAGEWMSVCAPGYNIISTYNGRWTYGGPSTGTDTHGVQFMSGTSMATPFVTGLIGYLLSFEEGQKLNAQQIKRLLEITADKIDSDNPYYGSYDSRGYSQYYGYGRVNVLEAAKCVAKKDGLPIPQAEEFYLSKPMEVTAYSGAPIRLYEILNDGTYFPQGFAMADSNGKTYFYGLRKGARYRMTCHYQRVEKEHIFTAEDKEMKHNFS